MKAVKMPKETIRHLVYKGALAALGAAIMVYLIGLMVRFWHDIKDWLKVEIVAPVLLYLFLWLMVIILLCITIYLLYKTHDKNSKKNMAVEELEALWDVEYEVKSGSFTACVKEPHCINCSAPLAIPENIFDSLACRNCKKDFGPNLISKQNLEEVKMRVHKYVEEKIKKRHGP